MERALAKTTGIVNGMAGYHHQPRDDIKTSVPPRELGFSSDCLQPHSFLICSELFSYLSFSSPGNLLSNFREWTKLHYSWYPITITASSPRSSKLQCISSLHEWKNWMNGLMILPGHFSSLSVCFPKSLQAPWAATASYLHISAWNSVTYKLLLNSISWMNEWWKDKASLS